MVPRIHLLQPLMFVRDLWEDVMSQAHSIITSTWTLYLQAEDGKVVIFQVCDTIWGKTPKQNMCVPLVKLNQFSFSLSLKQRKRMTPRKCKRHVSKHTFVTRNNIKSDFHVMSFFFFLVSFEVSDVNSPVYKDYERTLIQERDRDMSATDRSSDDYNFFSCLSRLNNNCIQSHT